MINICPIFYLTNFRLNVEYSSDETFDKDVFAKYLNALRNQYKYRDSKKREADAVIQFNDVSWALIEVKLGNEDDITKASNNLFNIASDIDYNKTGKPAFLMVVTKNCYLPTFLD